MITQALTDYYYELGPIRPPSEAYSLLIRATRNCPWNRCQFCGCYKGCKFELRAVEEILNDIKAAKAVSEAIRELAWRMGYGDKIREVAGVVCQQGVYSNSVRNVALWLWKGGESAFLQDANTLIMRTPDLVKVLSFLKEMFPSLTRITSYGRSKTAAKKTVEELKELKDAGLSRLHIGLESGSDVVLSYMEKGVTAEDHIRGGKKVVEAGISLCAYVMPGLGGRRCSQEHALETARVLNEINPNYIRLRSLHVRPEMPLWSKVESGEFELLSEDEVVAEISLFLEKLEVTSELKSDHILNLLPEIDGKLPETKPYLLQVISRYLSLPLKDRLNFRLGRRSGYYERLDDLENVYKYQKVEEVMKRIGANNTEDVDRAISRLKNHFI